MSSAVANGPAPTAPAVEPVAPTPFRRSAISTSVEALLTRAEMASQDTAPSSDDGRTFETASSGPPSEMASPPYWLNHQRHHRAVSDVSVDSLLAAGAITMRDNEVEDADDRSNACWAKSVEVTDFVVVNSSVSNIGAFVVWNIRVDTLTGSYMNIRKRYSEFDDFRRQLILTFPNFEAAVPALPPKSVISKFRPQFLEKRRAGLQYFLNCILLNPEFSSSPVLKDFLFA